MTIKSEVRKLWRTKTAIFNTFMGMVQAVNGCLALFQPVLNPDDFAMLALVIGVLHAVGGVLLRKITKTAVE